jgi:hypothetical protein
MDNGNKSSADRIASYRWPKGTSGNLKGRPRKRILTAEYESVLESPAPSPIVTALAKWGARPGDTWSRLIALSQARNALLTTASAAVSAKELREATEGKSTKCMEFVTAEERAITISVEYEPARTSRPVLDDRRIESERIIEAKPESSETE